MVDALFVDPKGIYPQLLGAERCWGEERDARTYNGYGPVVAHPPCQLWSNMAAAAWGRWHKRLPAWYRGGSDNGLFAMALVFVRVYGGVLEHPAGSHAWAAHGLTSPGVDASYPHWRPEGTYGHRSQHGWAYSWVCEVWQTAYGHKARKRTWLLYCGARPPFELNWAREPGTHQVGFQDKRGKARNKPTLSKAEANATPEPFARELIRLAEWSRS